MRITRFKKCFKTYQKGFTLIELLVVISIISLLSVVILTAVEDNRNKAKDRALVQSAIQLRNALELYKADNGDYPQMPYPYVFCTKNTSGVITCNGSGPDYGTPALREQLMPYIQEILVPQHNGSSYYYYQSSIKLKCEGQTVIPKYVILIQPKNDTTFPRYLSSGTTPHPTLRCLSAPE